MCRLPRDVTRLKVWIDNIDRKDWIPGSSSTLCHVHFTEDMWDKTRDGKRRLKSDAVPTIFGERIIPVQTIQQAVYEPAQIKLETEDVPSQLSKIEESGTEASHKPAQIKLETEDVPSQLSEIEESGTEASHKPTQIKLETEDVPSQLSEIEESGTEASHELPLQQIYFYKDDENSNLEKRLSRLEKLFDASEKAKLKYKRELHTANRRIKILENKIRNLQQVRSLSTVLKEDQIKVMTKTYKKIQ